MKLGYVRVGLLGLMVSLVLVGCVSAPTVTVDAVDAQKAFAGKTVDQALKETEATMLAVKGEDLAFYSPGFFGVSQKALEEARFLVLAPKETSADGKSAEAEIFAKLSLANESLAQAKATKPEVQKRLKEILIVRESLVAKGIDKSDADKYQDLMEILVGLFHRIEKKDLSDFAQSQAITLRQFKQLESQSVKAVQLEQGIAVLEQAEAIGAAGAAPKSYQKTQQALKNAHVVIERDPNDEAAIQSAVERFVFEANHLVHVASEVKEMRVLNHAAMENILLAAESSLLAISDALHQPDPRQKSLREQIALIIAAAEKLVDIKTPEKQSPVRHINKNELEDAQLRIEQLQAQMRDLQAENKQISKSDKPLVQRIDALERIVIKLNDEKSALETELAKTVAPPPDGVEITPLKK